MTSRMHAPRARRLARLDGALELTIIGIGAMGEGPFAGRVAGRGDAAATLAATSTAESGHGGPGGGSLPHAHRQRICYHMGHQ